MQEGEEKKEKEKIFNDGCLNVLKAQVIDSVQIDDFSNV